LLALPSDLLSEKPWITPMIIKAIVLPPSGPVWIDAPSNMNRQIRPRRPGQRRTSVS